MIALLSSCLCTVVHAVEADLHFHAEGAEESIPCHTPCDEDTIPCEHPEPTYRVITDDSVSVPPIANEVIALETWISSIAREPVLASPAFISPPPLLAGRSLQRRLCLLLI